MAKKLKANPTKNEIAQYIHCTQCLNERPADVSPMDWSLTQAGFTPAGFQVWCNRHDCNIVHIDFEGVKHPANVR